MPRGYRRFPKDTIEVETVNAIDVFRELGFDIPHSMLEGLDGLEGWNIFKKVGRAFKKVGRAIKKVKWKKVAAIGIPLVAAAVTGGLALPALPALLAKGASLVKGIGVSKFLLGPMGSKLLQQGKTLIAPVNTPTGQQIPAMVSPDEMARIAQIVKDPKQGIPQFLLEKILGRPAGQITIPGAQIKDGKLITTAPGLVAPPTVTTETIPAVSPMKKAMPFILGGGGLLLAMTMMRR